MRSITRRGFIAGSAVTAGLLGLAGCGTSSTTTNTDTSLQAPDSSKYPIDPDGDDVEAKWTSEKLRKDGWFKVTQDGGKTLGVMDEAKIIQVDGWAFRDANGNGKLDLYEDWRQSDEDRAKSLADQMTADEILPLMFHDGFTSSAVPLDDATTEKLGEGARAGVSRANTSIDSYANDIAWVNAIQEWCEENDKYGIPYMNSTDPYQLYDIPDPHCETAAFDPDLWKKSGRYIGRAWRSAGFRVDLGPQVDIGTNIIWTRLGGSLCEDPQTNRDFTREYAGGMQSTWGDDDCTDDQGWGEDSVATMLKHYVGPGATEGGRNDHNDAGKYDVFPGDNFNAHLIPFLDGGMKLDSSTGQMASVMPNYGIAYSEDKKYGPLWGGAYNARNIGILRNAGWDGMITTDWQVLRATDFGNRAHGVQDLTEAQRFDKLLEATVDQVGGDWAPDIAKDGYAIYEQDHGTDDALARVRDSARRIFTVMNHVQLFDQPYCDRDHCKEVLEDENAANFGQEVSNKCIVMLKNSGNIINKDGIQGTPKCYIPKTVEQPGMFAIMMGGSADPTVSMMVDEDDLGGVFDVVTDTDDGTSVTALTADELTSAGVEYVLFKIASPDTGAGESTDMMGNQVSDSGAKYLPISLQYRPYTATTARDPSIAGDIVDGVKENRSYKDQTVTASNEGDLDKLEQIRAALPNAKIILLVEGTNNAQCFHEIEPLADVILWSWASSGRAFGPAYGRILRGEVEPSGLLPCQMPKDMETVEAQQEDVPRDVDCYTDSEGNTYDFCFGLNWSGVINDDRVSKYKVEPLTEPETEVTPGEWSE